MGATSSLPRARTQPKPELTSTATLAPTPTDEDVNDDAWDLELPDCIGDETPVLKALLAGDALPDTPDDAFWTQMFDEHQTLLRSNHRPLSLLLNGADVSSYTSYAARAAHAVRAALHVMRGEPSTDEATAALSFGSEVVRALPHPQRAQMLGALDGGALCAADQADIGLAALWKLAAFSLDVLCASDTPQSPELLSSACSVVLAFLADDAPEGARDALPPIIERYAAPPQVVASLLDAAHNAIADGVDPVEVLRTPPEARTPPSRPVRTATAVIDVVSTVAHTITPRVVSNLASYPRLALPANTLLRTPAILRRGVPPETQAQIRAASDALCLLSVLVATDAAYRDAFLALRDDSERAPGFRNVFSAFCFWAQHPAAAMLTETLLSGNRKFRAYALSRTDLETLLVPLLRALFGQCAPSEPAADSYALTASLLVLTSDPGFCSAIDNITVPSSTLTWADPRGRLGNVPDSSLSALVLFMGARTVQQSLLSKRDPPQTYTASLALAAMANVASETSTLQAPIADRLVSLLDFLGRRVRRARIVADSESVPQPPDIHIPSTPNGTSQRAVDSNSQSSHDEEDENGHVDEETMHFENGTPMLGGRERTPEQVLATLRDLAGLALEIVAGVLRSNGDVSANRHLVYALLHREHLVARNGPLAPLSPQCGALCARLASVVRYFGSQVDSVTPDHPANVDADNVLSVERVFAVIDDSARLLPPELLADLPALRFEYHTDKTYRQAFMRHAAWATVERLAPNMPVPSNQLR